MTACWVCNAEWSELCTCECCGMLEVEDVPRGRIIHTNDCPNLLALAMALPAATEETP